METIALYTLIGCAAQMVDGAIGMAYGLTASSLLLTQGLAPATVSASVHTAEIFTTGISGFSHWRLGNFDRGIFLRLLAPGMVGGAVGALVLASSPAGIVRPLVSLYLLVMGFVILVKALRLPRPVPKSLRGVPPLAFAGAVLDAIGGGGWGPLVTSTMVGWGIVPRVAIGTSNAAEFFITVVIAGILLPSVDTGLWTVIVGLVIGGAVAAPFAAFGARVMPARLLMAVVGAVVVSLSLNDLGRALWS